ncbi:MAG: DUF6497 family protein [Sulfitobacter sp.]|nr:DUF6497 family protein [Sulfitobacter sp.]
MKPLILSLVLAASPALAIDVPSGQPITLQEVLVDTIGAETWLRFRFVAPEITSDAEGQDPEATASDMTFLCETMALPYIAEYGLSGDVIVVSLASQETEFGVSYPDATQFFEAYRVQDNTCIWEGL